VLRRNELRRSGRTRQHREKCCGSKTDYRDPGAIQRAFRRSGVLGLSRATRTCSWRNLATANAAREIQQGFPNNADSVVVLLDGEQAFKKIDAADIDIYWGANIGTEDEILVSGRVPEVVNDIEVRNNCQVVVVENPPSRRYGAVSFENPAHSLVDGAVACSGCDAPEYAADDRAASSSRHRAIIAGLAANRTILSGGCRYR
jgi:hypothetical protein